MLTSQGRPDHTLDAEIGLVKLPGRNQLVDDGLLLRNSVQLWHEARIAHHTAVIKPRTETDCSRMTQIQEQRPILALGSERRLG